MSEIVDRLQPPMNSVVMASWYRTLGINSIHTGISEVKDFIQARDNPYEGSLKKVNEGPVLEVHKWEDINISNRGADDPITFDAWIYGREINTVFTREKFYDLHLVRGAVERRLDLEPGSIEIIQQDNINAFEDVVKDSPLTVDSEE